MKYLKNIRLAAMMIGTVIFTSCSNSQTTESSKTETTIQTNQEKKVDFENAFIVDVRTPQEFADGHYAGAINIPLNTVEEHIDAFEGHEQIVVYCKSGARSGNAKKILEREGYTNVINAINLSHLNKLKKEQNK